MKGQLMKIQAHPFMRKKLTKLFIEVFILLCLLILLCIYGNRFISDFNANHYFIVLFSMAWIIVIGFFMTVWRSLTYLSCPICQVKTTTSSTHSELPDQYTAYCKQCNILWDLGIGKGD
jgi:hypothetical protein